MGSYQVWQTHEEATPGGRLGKVCLIDGIRRAIKGSAMSQISQNVARWLCNRARKQSTVDREKSKQKSGLHSECRPLFCLLFSLSTALFGAPTGEGIAHGRAHPLVLCRNGFDQLVQNLLVALLCE